MQKTNSRPEPTTTNKFDAWRIKLKAEIERTLDECQAQGTVGISENNLFQILHFPPGGPVGTNAAYVAKHNVTAIIQNLAPRYKRMIIPAA
jgi:hypothetical protein